MRPWLIFLLFTASSFGQIVTPIKNPKLTGDVDFNSITNKPTARTHLGVQTFDQDLTDFATAATWSGATDLNLNADVTLGALSAGEVDADNINSDSDIHADGVVSAGTRFLGPGASRSGFANGTAVLAATPDYDGQWLTATDGYVGFSLGLTPADVKGLFVIGDGVTYHIQDTQLAEGADLSLVGGNINAATTGTSGAHVFRAFGETFIDNVAYFHNTTGGYSAVVMIDPAGAIAANGPAATFGVGPAAATQGYAGNLYIATNPSGDSPTDAPPDILLTIERQDVATFTAHHMLRIDAEAKTTTIRGYTNDVMEGPVGLFVNAAGDVGAGTSTVASGAKLTVSGAVKSTQQAWSVHKNGSDQVVSAATWTTVTFGTEAYDQGGIFASNTATPTIAGLVHMQAAVYFGSTVDAERLLVAISKNGTRVCEVERVASNSAQETVVVPRSEVTDGNDTFTVEVFRSVGTSVSGGAVNTYFQGWAQ